jgi:hypothetical protein
MKSKMLVHLCLLTVLLTLGACSTTSRFSNKSLEKLGPRTNALHGGYNW